MVSDGRSEMDGPEMGLRWMGLRWMGLSWMACDVLPAALSRDSGTRAAQGNALPGPEMALMLPLVCLLCAETHLTHKPLAILQGPVAERRRARPHDGTSNGVQMGPTLHKSRV